MLKRYILHILLQPTECVLWDRRLEPNVLGRSRSGNGVTCRIKWNTPELHTAQPLDYLSHFTSQVTSVISTRYSGVPSRGGRTSIRDVNRNRHKW